MKQVNYIRRFGWIVFAIIIATLFAQGGLFFWLPYRSLAPFEGQVVDTETKKPIEGAVVLAVYYFTRYTIAGSNSYIKDGQETVTNKKGEFKLPRTRRWFVSRRGYPEGKVVIFKPGYGVFPRHRRSTAVGANKGWPSPGEYAVYGLPKLKTLEERKKAHLNSYDGIPYKYRKQYFEAENKERLFLGYEPFPVPYEE